MSVTKILASEFRQKKKERNVASRFSIASADFRVLSCCLCLSRRTRQIKK